MSATNNPTDNQPDSEPIKDTFQLLKDFYAGDLDDPSLDDDDAVTVSAGVNASLTQTRLNLRVPGDDEASSKATEILTATNALEMNSPPFRSFLGKLYTLRMIPQKETFFPLTQRKQKPLSSTTIATLLKSQVTSASKSFMIPPWHPRILITSLPRTFLNPDANFYRSPNQMRCSPR